MTSRESRTRRWGAAAVFFGAWGGVIAIALLVTLIGMAWVGGALAWQQLLAQAAPAFLVWRIVVYAVLGTAYLKVWRPRLLAMQQEQADGGDAARQRLGRIERIGLIGLVAIEVANLPTTIHWISG